jgi:DNA-binding CsgD family transcriptional regulator
LSDQSALLVGLADYLATKPTMDEIAQHLALETCADFRPRTVLISLFDSTGTVRTVGTFGVPLATQSDLALASLWDDVPASEAILNGSPLVFASVEEFVDRYPNLRDHAELVAPAVIWPIQSGQQRFGAIHMQCEAIPDGEISDEELHGLGTVLSLYLRVTDYRPGGASAHTELTPRQLEVLGYMEQGATNGQIAKRLGFSESTIKQETMAIYRYFGVHSRAEAIRIIQSSL